MKTGNNSRHYKPLIFIVEDIPKNVQVLCNILRKEDYRIAIATNGKQAIKMIPNVLPDLILMDVMMPEMDGFQACVHLKKDPVARGIPLIFLTAKVDATDIVKGFEIGAIDYITKPFNGSELIARVRTHLELKFAREALIDLNATKDKFFSIIAHDLKNPMQSLLLFTDTLYTYYGSFDEDRRREYIHRCYDSSKQVTALLKNLLDWARAQTGVIEPHHEIADVGVLIHESIRLLSANAEDKEITLSNEIEDECLSLIDTNMIRTLIRNLISNAIKFTRRGGAVNIKAIKKKRLIEIIVSDNGVGIAPENIDGLFRIDVQKSTEGTEHETGTGLGLILCKEFAEKNNGSISVTSKLGKGSSFKIKLPVPKKSRK
ncbi:MAG: hybrid sensor histidine kinase/response regulator [bacterium]|nr:hybrid sensor histidine kinase/response regulator [bacterium]